MQFFESSYIGALCVCHAYRWASHTWSHPETTSRTVCCTPSAWTLQERCSLAFPQWNKPESHTRWEVKVFTLKRRNNNIKFTVTGRCFLYYSAVCSTPTLFFESFSFTVMWKKHIPVIQQPTLAPISWSTHFQYDFISLSHCCRGILSDSL